MISHAWLTGEGMKIIPMEKHDREILCMAVQGDNLVTGSSDHALHLYDLKANRLRRRLFTPKFGHHEWVTCCDFNCDGQVVSGGMDAKICVWDKSIPKCIDLQGHSTSVSQIVCDKDTPLCASASYDKTLKIWNTKSGACLQTFVGHSQPVNDCVWRRSLLLSTGRDGLLIGWDVNTGTRINTIRHTSPIAAIHLFADELGFVATGTQDGTVAVYDLRDFRTAVFTSVLHPNAVCSSVKSFDDREATTIITSGSDRRVVVVDSAMGFAPRAELTGHQAPVHSLCTVPFDRRTQLVVSGADNGWVLVHNAATADGKTNACFGSGIVKSGVRCLEVNDSMTKLCVGGDDLEPVVLDFSG